MLADVKEIRMLRKRHNLTQTQLARLAGVSQSLVAKVEAGMIDPSYGNFRKLHDALTGLKEKEEPKAGELMSGKLISAGKETPLSEIVRKMRQHDISQMPVIEKGSVIGLVGEADVIESVHQGKDVKKLKAADVMGNAPPTVPKETPLGIVTELLRMNPLVIVTEKGASKGAVTKADVLKRLTK